MPLIIKIKTMEKECLHSIIICLVTQIRRVLLNSWPETKWTCHCWECLSTNATAEVQSCWNWHAYIVAVFQAQKPSPGIKVFRFLRLNRDQGTGRYFWLQVFVMVFSFSCHLCYHILYSSLPHSRFILIFLFYLCFVSFTYFVEHLSKCVPLSFLYCSFFTVTDVHIPELYLSSLSWVDVSLGFF